MARRMEWSVLAASVLVIVGALACKTGSRSSPALVYGSADDVEKLLAGAGAKVAVSDCENLRYGDGGGGTRDPGITRALSCTTKLTAAEQAALTSSLGLVPATASTTPPLTGSCAARGFVAGPGYDAKELRGAAASATRFKYVLVVVETATERTCVEVEYPWG